MEKVILVYGLGLSGQSAIELLKQSQQNIAVYSDEYCEYNINGLEDRRGLAIDDVLKNVALIVISPSILLDCPLLVRAKELNIDIIGEMELGFRNCKSDIIAVTGTNGKTTTVELLGHMLNSYGIDAKTLGNNGIGFSENVTRMQESSVAVLETSSFQLNGIELFQPKYAIVTNISPDHIEYHKTFKDYVHCKKNIFKNQNSDDYSILNYDDGIVRDFAEDLHSQVYYFSTKQVVKGSYICGNGIYFKENIPEYVCNIDSLNIIGEHNLQNTLACITVCKLLNMPNQAIKNSLESFVAPPHRVEYVGEMDGVKYYNDSKSTNISSTLSACKSMNGRTVLLMGGYDKGLSYKELFQELPLKISAVIVYGANKMRLIEDSNCVGYLTVISANDLEDAINIASKVKVKNVLFSPGTSSYDSFNNYIERGNYFVEYIKGIGVE